MAKIGAEQRGRLGCLRLVNVYRTAFFSWINRCALRALLAFWLLDESAAVSFCGLCVAVTVAAVGPQSSPVLLWGMFQTLVVCW